MDKLIPKESGENKKILTLEETIAQYDLDLAQMQKDLKKITKEIDAILKPKKKKGKKQDK